MEQVAISPCPSLDSHKSPRIAIVTTYKNEFCRETIIGIVECKFRKKLSTSEIRQELGKAVDLGLNLTSDEYTIVTHLPPEQKLRDGAKHLGITLIEFGLWSSDRDKYLSGTKKLGQDLVLGFSDASNLKPLAGAL